MLTVKDPVEFVGINEATGELYCGLLTPLIDLVDLPLTGSRLGTDLYISTAAGQSFQFKASPTLIAALDKETPFWVGNLEGSEEAWLVDLS